MIKTTLTAATIPLVLLDEDPVGVASEGTGIVTPVITGPNVPVDRV